MKCIKAASIFVSSSVFISSANAFQISSIALPSTSPSTSPSALFISENKDPSGNSKTSKKMQTQEEFLEEASANGYDKIRSISIEERTRRAMLAEAAEDRMVALSDELDALFKQQDRDKMNGIGDDKSREEQVLEIARAIQTAEEQYQAMVNGDDSPFIDLQ